MIESELTQLRWDVEMKMSTKCWSLEREADEKGNEYKCFCPDILKMSEDELQKYLDDK